VQVSAVQPWLEGSLGVVQRVFVEQVHPLSQGISSQPCASARALATAHRYPTLQL
jgi:hypothetical protein